MSWTARPQVDEDLIVGRNFIRPDNPCAALAFLDAAFALFGWHSFPRWALAPD